MPVVGYLTMKAYKLYLAKPLLIMYLFFFGLWVLGGAGGIIAAVLGVFGADGPPAFAFAIALAGGLFNSYMWLRVPFEIRILDDTSVQFRSLLRKTTVSPADIKSVRAKRYALGLVDVLHGGGTVHLLNQMDGFHDFVSTIKSLNPAIKIAGC